MIDKLYETIGGAEVIRAAIGDFYRRVLEDEHLRDFFAQTDMANLEKGQSMFLSMLLGGRVVYTGRDIGEAHHGSRLRGLTDVHFDRFVAHFRDALHEVGVDSGVAEKVVKLLEAKRAHIIGQTGAAHA